MNTQTQEALRLSVEAIQDIMRFLDDKQIWYPVTLDKAKYACKEALEQPAQEPNITQIIKKYKGEMTYYDHEPLGVYFTIGHFEKLLNELKG
jgi:hypothetical protein